MATNVVGNFIAYYSPQCEGDIGYSNFTSQQTSLITTHPQRVGYLNGISAKSITAPQGTEDQ